MPERASSVVADILLGGLLAGTIDLGVACLINSVGLSLVLQAVASGVLGRASYQGGLQSAALGLGLQWAMSLLIAAIFVLGTAALPAVRRRWALAGVVYGAVIFVVMNYAVMPLSAIGHAPRFTTASLLLNLLAMLLFGVIVTFCARPRTGLWRLRPPGPQRASAP
jgi:hypothetical protein